MRTARTVWNQAAWSQAARSQITSRGIGHRRRSAFAAANEVHAPERTSPPVVISGGGNDCGAAVSRHGCARMRGRASKATVAVDAIRPDSGTGVAHPGPGGARCPLGIRIPRA